MIIIFNIKISSIQKCILEIKILAYGFAYDACDEYVQLADTIQFGRANMKIYESTYLHKPTKEELQK